MWIITLKVISHPFINLAVLFFLVCLFVCLCFLFVFIFVILAVFGW